MATILIIDDEKEMRELLRLYLEPEGFTCIEADDGEAGLAQFGRRHVDLILLDIMMPKLDGYRFCMHVRERSQVPIIFLTARSDEWDRVYGLKIGADDYIVKPFSPNEVVARVHAVLRRTKGTEATPQYEAGPIIVDEKARKVTVNGNHVLLTLKEFELLVLFLKHRGQVFTREQLLDRVWGIHYVGSTRTVDTHIKTLRIKLGEAGQLIQTVWGVGYKFDETV
ncbi:transcriptional regulator [Anoxybacillus gonensis]|nr:response regulator transcription factor [Anoxybacillus gonensis]KGP61889.1 transcriptional regulator [Anoxybacillus gonensis]MCQ5364873.1 response regulator transcription factor [Anoxybacillus gonensis]THD16004.1 DNA-binding response regulator [Anoxybacillus ayderensis]